MFSYFDNNSDKNKASEDAKSVMNAEEPEIAKVPPSTNYTGASDSSDSLSSSYSFNFNELKKNFEQAYPIPRMTSPSMKPPSFRNAIQFEGDWETPSLAPRSITTLQNTFDVTGFSGGAFGAFPDLNHWNQSVLSAPDGIDMVHNLEIPKKFLNMLRNFEVPETSVKPMHLKLQQIEEFQFERLPGLKDGNVNLWDFVEDYPFMLHVIEQINYKERTFKVARTNCYVDNKGVLQDEKKPKKEEISQKYEQMISERTHQDASNDKENQNNAKSFFTVNKKEKLITKEELKVLVSDLYRDTKQLVENDRIQNFVNSLCEEFSVTEKAFHDYCKQHQKYMNLKESIEELSKQHDRIKEQIENLETHQESMRSHYQSLNETLQESLSGMLNSIDTEAMGYLQRNIEEVAGRYHYLREVRDNILGKLKVTVRNVRSEKDSLHDQTELPPMNIAMKHLSSHL